MLQVINKKTVIRVFVLLHVIISLVFSISTGAHAAPPVVKTVPWVATNALIPHDTWSGKEITLKGTADVSGANIQYSWDFGDGSPVVTGMVTDPYVIEAKHVYMAPAGTIFTARLSVQNTNTGETGNKAYFVQVRDRNLPIEVNVAIDEGLWYLHKFQTRTNEGGVDYGDWRSRSGCRACLGFFSISSANINAFEVNGHLESGDVDNPYVETVARGMRRLFTYLTTENLTNQTYPAPTGVVNPDSNGNGIGIRVNQSHYTYQGGMFIDAVIASGTPDAMTSTGAANVVNRSYADVVQDMVDSYAFGQDDRDAVNRGSWVYGWNSNRVDNSAAQWAAIGLIPAERIWNLTVPDWVKTENENALNYSQNADGRFGYSANNSFPWGPYATTPSGMVQLAMDGIGRGDARWDRAETWLRDRFGNEGNSTQSLKNYYYGLFAFSKAMLLHNPDGDINSDPIELLQSQTAGVAPLDWYLAEISQGDPTDGVARTLVDDQIVSGEWWANQFNGNQYYYDTAWAILMLSRTLFEAGSPVAVAQVIPNPAVAGQQIILDGSKSFHQDGARQIVNWEWDLDNDGSFETTGAQTTVSFPALGDYVVRLRVTDDNNPARSAETSATVRITIPPIEPTANAGGPYLFCPGVNWYLDGSQSNNPDEGQSEPGQPGDTIQSYNWDIDGSGSFSGATGVQPDVSAFFGAQGVGDYLVQLRVTDTTSSSFPSSGLADLSDTDFAQVSIKDGSDLTCSCLTDLAARAKRGKVQLTWTDSGAHHYNVYRSTTANGPYQFIAATDSRYSTYLDNTVNNGTTFYYVVREAAASGNEVCQSVEADATPTASRRARNNSPVITSAAVTSAVETVAYRYDVEAVDGDNDPITFSLDTAPTGMSIDPSTGLIEWTPVNAQVGLHDVVVRVRDSKGASTTQLFSIQVANFNNAPQIVSVPVDTAIANSVYLYDVDAIDNDPADILDYSLDTAPSGMSIDPASGLISWIPTDAQVANHAVTARVTDGSLSVTQSFDVLVLEENKPPVITSTPVYSATQGLIYNYSVEGSDPNVGDSLTFSLDQAPAGMSIAADGIISWIPAETQIGLHDITIRVTDSNNLASTQAYQMGVVNENNAPQIDSSPVTSATEEELYSYDVNATDSDVNDVLVFSLVVAPSGMSINPVDGLLQWTPSNAQVGSHAVVVEVVDALGLTDRQDFGIIVGNVNDAPIIVSSAVLLAGEGLAYRYNVAAQDPDAGDTLTFSLDSAPAGMGIDPVSGEIDWLPTTAQVGSQLVAVRVLDSTGASATHAFTVSVQADADLAVVPDIVGQTQGAATSLLGNVNLTVGNITNAFSEIVAVDSIISQSPISGNKLPTGSEVDLVISQGPMPQLVPDLANLSRVDAEAAIVAAELVVGDVLVQSSNTVPDGLVISQDPVAGTYLAKNSTVNLIVSSGLDLDPPQVSINNPVSGAIVSYLTDITASVTATDLDFYQLDYARVDKVDLGNPASFDPDWTTISTGISEITNQVVGTFDPTILQNNDYALRLLAWDNAGNGAAQAIVLGVNGNAKLGQFGLEYTDLDMPLAGVPIQVIRRYNSLDSAELGDFGQGWTLGFADPDIRETVPVNPNEALLGLFATNAVRDGMRVYLTDPDGKRVGFTFETEPGVSLIGTIYFPRFKADPGVYDTLEVDNISLSKQADGRYTLFLLGFNYNPADFRLVRKDGKVFHYNQFSGLKKVTDANGHVLTFQSNGIFHSGGDKIDFVRDSEGRISQIVDPDGNIIEYQYDSNGDLIAVTNQQGGITGYTYLNNPAHYLEKVTDPTGRQAVRTEYDANGRLLATIDGDGNRIESNWDPANFTGTITDARLNVTTLVYDAQGNILEEIDPLGGVILRTYDASNNVSSVTDQNGNTNQYTYDSLGNVLTETNPLGGVYTTTYDSAGNKTSLQDPLGRVRNWTYDAAGNVLAFTNALGNQVTLNYDAEGRYSSFSDFNGNETLYEYDASFPGPARVIQPDGEIASYEYHFTGKFSGITDENGGVQTYHYNASGMLTHDVNALGNQNSITYDGHLITGRTDPLGNVTNFEYDDASRQIREIDALGGISAFTYDAAGNQTSVTDPGGNTTGFFYDELNRLSRRLDPFGNVTEYAYDAVGNLVEITDRNGRRQSYSYDALDRVTQEIWTDNIGTEVNVIAKSYDALGNLLTVSDNVSSLSYTYDDLNRVVSVSNSGTAGVPEVILNYTYDDAGNKIQVSDQTGIQSDSEYDNRHRLTSRNWSGPGIQPVQVNFTYDGVGNRSSATRQFDSGGLQLAGTSAFSYDSLGRMTDLNHADASVTNIADYVYSYDGVNRLVSAAHHGKVVSHTYDALGQVIQSSDSSFGNESFSYDSNGNRKNAGNVTGLNNQVLADGVADYSYDMEGNVITRTDVATGDVTTYGYEHNNRLINVEKRSPTNVLLNQTFYVYYALGRRISSIVDGQEIHHVYDGEHVWADFDAAAGVDARYLFGNESDEIIARNRSVDSNNHWYLSDSLGSVGDIADLSGNGINSIDYSSFGKTLAQVDPLLTDRYRFSGREYEESTGLYYYRARYYDPDLGRFISEDPVGFEADDLNLYRYVGNSPQNATDPGGNTAAIEYGLLLCDIADALANGNTIASCIDTLFTGINNAIESGGGNVDISCVGGIVSITVCGVTLIDGNPN